MKLGNPKRAKTGAERQTACRHRKKHALTQVTLDVDGDEIADALWRRAGINIHPKNADHLRRACALIVKTYCHNVTCGTSRLWQTRSESQVQVNDAHADENTKL